MQKYHVFQVFDRKLNLYVGPLFLSASAAEAHLAQFENPVWERSLRFYVGYSDLCTLDEVTRRNARRTTVGLPGTKQRPNRLV
jgi:hypothetical protein